MKKYIVINTDNQPPYCQEVTIQNVLGEKRVITLAHSVPSIPTGTKFNLYETANKEPFPLDMAYSYSINNKRFVQIPQKPKTMYAIENFWNTLGFWDGIRLHIDIMQALRRQKITPSLNKNTNLYLLLGNTVIR